jgi:hypothetical protein
MLLSYLGNAVRMLGRFDLWQAMAAFPLEPKRQWLTPAIIDRPHHRYDYRSIISNKGKAF